MKMIRSLALVFLASSAVMARPALDSMSLVCSMSKACLGSAPAACTPAQQKPLPKVKYNAGFCDEAKILTQDGIRFESAQGRMPWIQLGRKLRIEYEESGLLPLPAPAVEYLMSHLGLAVELVNLYEKSTYKLWYKNTDSLSFGASNGKSLSGGFQFLTPRKNLEHHVFYGEGVAALPGPLKILFGGGKGEMSLRGDALVFLDFQPRAEKTSWQMRLVVFPEDNMINKAMGMGAFRNKVSSYIQEIIGDISKAAQEYAKGNREPLASSEKLKDPEVAAQLATFEALLHPVVVPETQANPVQP